MLKFRGLPGVVDPYVRIGVFDFRTSLLFETLSSWSITTGKTVTINAVDNGRHGKDGTVFTFHGLSLAWDIGVEDGGHDNFITLGNFLKMMLPPPYEVVIEVDHVHIEWDTHSGR